MSKGTEVSAEMKNRIYRNARALALSLLALLFVVFAFLLLSKAWLSLNRDTEASGLGIQTVNVDGIDFHIYKWDNSLNDGAGDWQATPIDQIDMNLSVPNETEKYKIVGNSSFQKVSLLLNAVSNQNETVDDDLYNYVSVIYDDAEHVLTDAIADAGYAYTFLTDGTNETVFQIHISKSVTNDFAEDQITGNIAIS